MRLAERYLQQLVGGALLLLLVAVALSPPESALTATS